MPLQSKPFRGDAALEACLLHDSKHITPGSKGNHVRKIQDALTVLDDAQIDPAEIASGNYGPFTAAAVLSYKTARNIVNHRYQRKADNIVGKMTIAAMDSELCQSEVPSPRIPGVLYTMPWRVMFG